MFLPLTDGFFDVLSEVLPEAVSQVKRAFSQYVKLPGLTGAVQQYLKYFDVSATYTVHQRSLVPPSPRFFVGSAFNQKLDQRHVYEYRIVFIRWNLFPSSMVERRSLCCVYCRYVWSPIKYHVQDVGVVSVCAGVREYCHSDVVDLVVNRPVLEDFGEQKEVLLVNGCD